MHFGSYARAYAPPPSKFNLVLRFITVEWDPVDFLIRERTGGFCSHTEALTADNKWLGAHAGTGVQLREYDYCKPTWERRYALPVTEKQYSDAVAYGLGMVGTPYGYRSVFADLFNLAWDADKASDGVDCSWFMTNYLQAAGFAPLNVLPEFADKISPEMLHASPIFIGRCIEPKAG